MSLESKTEEEIWYAYENEVFINLKYLAKAYIEMRAGKEWVPLEDAQKEIEAIKKANETFVYSKFNGYKICVPIEELELKTIENNQLKAKIVEAQKEIDLLKEYLIIDKKQLESYIKQIAEANKILSMFPDSRKFEPKETDPDKSFDDAGYCLAISDWFTNLRGVLKP